MACSGLERFRGGAGENIRSEEKRGGCGGALEAKEKRGKLRSNYKPIEEFKKRGAGPSRPFEDAFQKDGEESSQRSQQDHMHELNRLPEET